MTIQGDKRQRKERNDNQKVDTAWCAEKSEREKGNTEGRKNAEGMVCVVCVLDREGETRERERERSRCARRGGATRTSLEGRRLQVGVDEERCVDDTEHRRTGDCFEQDWDGKERHRRERSWQRGNETKRAAISSRGGKRRERKRERESCSNRGMSGTR